MTQPVLFSTKYQKAHHRQIALMFIPHTRALQVRLTQNKRTIDVIAITNIKIYFIPIGQKNDEIDESFDEFIATNVISTTISDDASLNCAKGDVSTSLKECGGEDHSTHPDSDHSYAAPLNTAQNHALAENELSCKYLLELYLRINILIFILFSIFSERCANATPKQNKRNRECDTGNYPLQIEQRNIAKRPYVYLN